MVLELKVYPDLCHGCGNCVVACPVNASNNPDVAGGKGPTEDNKLVIIVEDGTVTILNPELCEKCGTCVESCPVDAIRLEESK